MSAMENQARYPMPHNKKQSPKLDDLAASKIGKTLRAQFDEIVSEPVPDRFLDLLNRLEAAEESGKKDADHE